jgi:hypothetical protein
MCGKTLFIAPDTRRKQVGVGQLTASIDAELGFSIYWCLRIKDTLFGGREIGSVLHRQVCFCL